MVRAKNVVKALVDSNVEGVHGVVFKQNTVTVAWRLVFLVDVLLVIKVSLVCWFEFDLIFKVIRILTSDLLSHA